MSMVPRLIQAVRTLERWLRTRPLLIAVIVALALCFALGSRGNVSEFVMPFGDGEHYVMRCLTLYGFLHSGQWGQFWNIFTLPDQSLAPPNYLLFFLLPERWASMTSYGILQLLTIYLLLAVGAWNLCRVLDRAEWSPALFLLCAFQNVALNESYLYFEDMAFLAMGMVVLAGQMWARRFPSWQNNFSAGVGVGLMFWIKSPNALIFLGTFLVAELVGLARVWWDRPAGPKISSELPRRALGWLAGFLPVFLLAMKCGAFQAILRLVNANELSGRFVTQLDCTGIKRALYFPLCLTFFYDTALLAGIIVAVLLISLVSNRYSKAIHPEFSRPSGGALLVPVVVAYIVLGASFSFGMENKEMRSLLLVLPVFWLAAFWLAERLRVRSLLMLLAATGYAGCILSQIFFNTFGSTDRSTESYQLEGDWLTRLPEIYSEKVLQYNNSQTLFGFISQALPDGGKVAVGSDLIFVTSESLTWVAERDLAMQGRHSPYEFQNFLSPEGAYKRRALENAKGIMVYVYPPLQYSRDVFFASTNLVRFSLGPWRENGFAGATPLRNSDGALIGVLVLPSVPLDDTRIDELMTGTGSSEVPTAADVNPPADQRLTWAESRHILLRWARKRFGWGTP